MRMWQRNKGWSRAKMGKLKPTNHVKMSFVSLKILLTATSGWLLKY